ncbi:MAG: cation diffusion facilitator family transporter [Planctomycetia bacterium]|nr:cation diffusion facilitator family transporter [Planctomycetia bacterium]
MESRQTVAEQAVHEKNAAAVASVTAAIGLTLMKLLVGWWTNSLGILSEAAHSGLDLVAAVVACWAVRTASRPADVDHPYGHGRVESLSSLFETGLLLVTCVWIVRESLHRLFSAETPEVNVNIWAFVVVLISISVDVVRSRHLKQVAQKHRSEALEADALHFSTDVWSSCVVLIGLIATWISIRFPTYSWLHRADSVAALGVACIVTWVCLRMGNKSLRSLMDAVTPDESAQLESSLRKVCGDRTIRCRMRHSGAEVFADVTVVVDPTLTFEQSHELTEQIEQSVRSLYPESQTTVHCEPIRENLPCRTRILLTAARLGQEIHHLTLTKTSTGIRVEFHLELPPTHTVRTAHEAATTLERAIRRDTPEVREMVTHCEPAVPEVDLSDPGIGNARDVPVEELLRRVRESVEIFRIREPLCAGVHAIRPSPIPQNPGVSLHVAVDGNTLLPIAHELTERLEQFLRLSIPELRRVSIHIEPV